jgi:hypothetical protein
MFGGKLFTKRIVSIWLLFLLLLSTFSIHADYFRLEEDKEIYTIYVDSQERGDPLENLDVIETYDSFVLARLTDYEANKLRNRNIDVVEEPNLSTLAIDGFVFDTRDGPPKVPGYLQVPEPSRELTTSFILQFKGPIKSEWVSELEGLGVQMRDYIPFHSFLTRMTPEVMEKVERLSFVQWVGFYEPMYKVQPDLWSENDDILVEIILFKEESGAFILSALGDMVVDWYTDGEFNIIEALIPPAVLPALAKLNEVYYIEPRSVMVPLNVNAQVVFQTNRSKSDPLARRIWDMGIQGGGEIITVADTGLDYDHTMVRHSNGNITIGDIYNVTDPNRRKLIRYMVMKTFNPESDPWAWKDSGHVSITGNLTTGHGTSVAVAAAGNDDGTGTSKRDGMAKEAKLIVQDIGTVCRNPMHGNWWDDCLRYIPNNYSDMFLPAHENGSRIHSNSWGSSNSNYDREARMVDMFNWAYKDMVILFANGNGGGCWGTYHRTGSPATAKSAVSVGMTEGWRNQHNVSCGSSTGPTDDERMKPDTVAFGSGRSARSSGDPFDEYNTSEEGWFGGSSYATPLTSGMAAMLRQYFLEGWYPSGVSNTQDSLYPSAALIKAMLVNSGMEMTGNNSDVAGDGQYPNNSQGWGRPTLDDVMYFMGDRRKTLVWDNQSMDSTGDSMIYSFNVKSGLEPLKVNMVYTDYPGALFSSFALVNNLDLEVFDPLGNQYKGNVFWSYSDATPGESRPNWGNFDIRNPVEGVIVKNPMPGYWTVRVTGFDLPKGPQPFAFVVTGMLDPVYVPEIAPPTNVWAEIDGALRQNVLITWEMADETGVDHYDIYYSTDYSENGGYNYLGSTAVGNLSFTHSGAGQGNPLNFFYYVQANGTGNKTGRSSQQVGKFVRLLDQGMNLVSFPLEQRVESLQTVLQTVWDRFDMLRVFDSGTDTWKTYWRHKGYGDLSTLDHRTGFWIRLTAPGFLYVAGRVVETEYVQLVSGWNLMGNPFLHNMTVAESFFNVTYSAIEGYYDTDPYYLREMDDNSTFSPGYAYWVYLETDQFWYVYSF